MFKYLSYGSRAPLPAFFHLTWGRGLPARMIKMNLEGKDLFE